MFLPSPWLDTFLDLAAASKNTIQISSPFIKSNIINELCRARKPNVQITILTNYRLGSIVSKSLDISALVCIVNNQGLVFSNSRLHCKIYLFDGQQAVVTSGNLTTGGLTHNHEAGILLNDAGAVRKVQDYFDSLISLPETYPIQLRDLQTTESYLLGYIEYLKQIRFDLDTNTIQPESIGYVAATLNGWNHALFDKLIAFKTVFSIDEVYQLADYFSILYPKNNNIPEKLRQALQSLRNRGLISFEGNGRYRKLF